MAGGEAACGGERFFAFSERGERPLLFFLCSLFLFFKKEFPSLCIRTRPMPARLRMRDKNCNFAGEYDNKRTHTYEKTRLLVLDLGTILSYYASAARARTTALRLLWP